MRTKYDPETDALYLRFADAPVAETEEVRPGVMFDLDAEGRIIAIEVLDASARLNQSARLVLGADLKRDAGPNMTGLKETFEHNDGDVSMRHHQAAVRAIEAPRKRIDPDLLRSLTATMPPQTENTAALVRSIRDGVRY